MDQQNNAASRLYRVEHIMGMPILLDIRDKGVDATLAESVFDWFRWVDSTFSTYKTESEIMRLNRGELTLAEVHPEVRAVLERCAELRDETEGYFNCESAMLYQVERVGPAALRIGAVDPSGYVKGWAVERAALLLGQAGVQTFSINAGGDIALRGYPTADKPWRIGIQHPRLRDKIAAVVATTDQAIATSGEYERGHHIVTPQTGVPPQGVLSVTIVGPDLGTADAYATAAFARGEEAAAWTAQLVSLGYEAMTIYEDDRVLLTPGFPSAPV